METNPVAPQTPPTAQIPSKPKPKRKRWPVYLAVAFVALFLVASIGFVTATTLEEHDLFCIACHTVPETTYYNRAYTALDFPTNGVTDLATMHYHLAQGKGQSFACINCHRGDSSLGQRISTVALGARDAAIYVLGKEDPTIEKAQISESWLTNSACVSCHTDTLLKVDGMNNHFHNFLPAAADALANGGKLTGTGNSSGQSDFTLRRRIRTVKTSLTCTDCHQAHKTAPNGMATTFMIASERNQECVTCHQAAREGPQDPTKLGGS